MNETRAGRENDQRSDFLAKGVNIFSERYSDEKLQELHGRTLNQAGTALLASENHFVLQLGIPEEVQVRAQAKGLDPNSCDFSRHLVFSNLEYKGNPVRDGHYRTDEPNQGSNFFFNSPKAGF
jgi:hypothetical protein